MHDVWITGIGVVSPIGLGKRSFFEGCLEGRCSARRLETEWARETGLSSQIVSPVEGFEPGDHGLDPKNARFMDRTTQFAVAAADAAVRDAALPLATLDERKGKFAIESVDPYRVASLIGSGIGGLTSLERAHATWRERRSKEGVKRYSLPMLIPNAAAGHVATRLGAKGPCVALSTACAAGTMAVGEAFKLIRNGEVDITICGGTEGVAVDHDCLALMGFDRLKTLSARNDDPQRASRPFDRDRDGFVLGEGAAVLVLERKAHAQKRGARPYAAVASYATNCDAHSMVQLDESGEAIRRVWSEALKAADVDRIDLISAHGTSTRLNDRVESKVAMEIFGGDLPPVTALKSMTGHGIAASGATELAAAALSLAHGVITPTINYETPDPECPVPVVTSTRESAPKSCLKPSYGFGGHNAALVLTAV